MDVKIGTRPKPTDDKELGRRRVMPMKDDSLERPDSENLGDNRVRRTRFGGDGINLRRSSMNDTNQSPSRSWSEDSARSLDLKTGNADVPATIGNHSELGVAQRQSQTPDRGSVEGGGGDHGKGPVRWKLFSKALAGRSTIGGESERTIAATALAQGMESRRSLGSDPWKVGVKDDADQLLRRRKEVALGRLRTLAILLTTVGAWSPAVLTASPQETSAGGAAIARPNAATKPPAPVAPIKYLETGSRLFNGGQYQLAAKYLKAAQDYRTSLSRDEQVILDEYLVEMNKVIASQPELGLKALAMSSAAAAPAKPAASYDPTVRAASTAVNTMDSGKQRGMAMLGQAREALSLGRVDEAKRLASQAQAMNLEYGEGEDTPRAVMMAAEEAINAPITRGGSGDSKQKGRWLLKTAREHISRGEFDQAMTTIGEVERLNLKWGLLEDSPSKARKDLVSARSRSSATTGMKTGDRDTAKNQLRVAREMIERNQLEQAEKVAREVDAWKIRYGQYDDTPTKVLDAIRAIRQRDAIRGVGSKASMTGSVYETLVKDARDLMAKGDYVQARNKANQARGLNVYPPATADRAESVLYDIDRTESKKVAAAGSAIVSNKPPKTDSAVALTSGTNDSAPMIGEPPSVKAERLANEALARGDKDQAAVLYTEAERLYREEIGAAAEASRIKIGRDSGVTQASVVAKPDPAKPAPAPAPAPIPAPRPRAPRTKDGNVNLVNDNGELIVVEAPIGGGDPPAPPPGGEVMPPPTSVAGADTPPPPPSNADVPPPAPSSAPTPTPTAAPMPVVADEANNSAMQMLEQARGLMAAGNYAAARERVAQIRQVAPEMASQADALKDQIQRAEQKGAIDFFESAMASFRAGDKDKAQAMLNEVLASNADADLRDRAQKMLERISQTPVAAAPGEAKVDSAKVTADDAQAIRIQKLNAEIAEVISASRRSLDVDPAKSIEMVEKELEKVRQQDLPAASGKTMIRRLEVALELAKTEKKDWELRTRDQRDRVATEKKRLRILEAEQAKLDRHSELMRKAIASLENGQYLEAEASAKMAQEVDPNDVTAVALAQRARFESGFNRSEEIRDAKERGNNDEALAVEATGVIPPGVSKDGLAYPETFADLTKARRAANEARTYKPTAGAMAIEKQLNKPVNINMNKQGLGEAIDYLRNYTGLNISVDPKALQDEGLTKETQVDLTLSNVKLKTALKYMLTPLGLTYQVDDEVLLITNQQSSNVKTRAWTYYVSDLVGVRKDQPAVNSDGGPSNISNANASVVNPTNPGNVLGSPTTNGGNANSNGGAANLLNGLGATTTTSPRPDYDMTPLLQLITTTIAPNTWRVLDGNNMENVVGTGYGALGGAGAAGAAGQIGTITPFFLNTSLIIRHTDEVHEQVEDLLRQLRRMQDLQVSIEVRFITLRDEFFEQMGVDFDFQIQDDTVNGRSSFAVPNPNATFFDPTGTTGGGGGGNNNQVSPFLLNPNRDHTGNRPFTIGLNQPNNTESGFSPNLNIPFSQNSFDTSTSPGLAPDIGANIGLAFLSDLEVYLFLRAAQLDQRTNLVQAPRVTTFNGNPALISATRQQYFVQSVTPVVSFGAIAFSPNIQSLPVGITLNVTPVVTADRRYVRLSLNPTFISDPSFQNFTVAGGVGGGGLGGQGAAIATTVQLPTFDIFTVNTTVTVPDGGTVLLGGVRRSTEERNEAGVPILGKTPFINRLFRNVGVRRSVFSNMLLVTPKIIILEEEEQKLGIPPASTIAL